MARSYTSAGVTGQTLDTETTVDESSVISGLCPVRPDAAHRSGRAAPDWLHFVCVALAAVTVVVGLPVMASGATGEASVSDSWTATSIGVGLMINGVACPTAQDCLAVGTVGNGVTPGGMILRSADAGATWTNVVFPGSAGTDLDGVACATQSACVAVGEVSAGGAGVIDVSTDRGRSWSQTAVPSAALLYGASCASAEVCEVVGTSKRRTGLIVSTTDGGRSWHLQRSPSGSADLDAVSCSSPRRCVGVGDELARGGERGIITVTTNGGRTWTATKVTHAIFLDGVSCSTVNRCAVAGFASNPIDPSTPGIVLATRNGGASWLRATVPEGRYGFRALSCIGSGRCVAVGESGHALAYSGLLMISNDGGNTWHELSPDGLEWRARQRRQLRPILEVRSRREYNPPGDQSGRAGLTSIRGRVVMAGSSGV